MSLVSSRRAVLPDLMAVRGLLAVWVFAYHANLHLGFAPAYGVVGHGYLGVDGFFILSGLVLAHRHPDLPLTLAAQLGFWWKRLVRLYPTHLAVLLLLLAAFLAAEAGGVRPHQALRADSREFLLQLLLLNGWGFSRGWTWNYPSWSISAEWAGYLVFPVATRTLSKVGAAGAVLALFLAAICIIAVDTVSVSGLNLSYHGALGRFFPEFLAGILLARILRLTPGALSPWVLALAGLLILILGLARNDAVAVMGLWFGLAALAVGPQTVLAGLPGLVGLGAISYPLYMVYTPVELAFTRLWASAHLDPTHAPLVWLAAMFAGVLALGWVVARLVERPALRHLAARRPDL